MGLGPTCRTDHFTIVAPSSHYDSRQITHLAPGPLPLYKTTLKLSTPFTYDVVF